MVQETGGWRVDDNARTYRGVRSAAVDESLRRSPAKELAMSPVYHEVARSETPLSSNMWAQRLRDQDSYARLGA